MDGKEANSKTHRRTAAGEVALDHAAFKEYVDTLNITLGNLSNAVKKGTGVEITPRQLARWYNAETPTGKEGYVHAVEITIVTLLKRNPEEVCIRRDPGGKQKSTSRNEEQTIELDEKQTENLLELHEASVAYRMAQVVQDTLSDTGVFDEEEFYERIKSALGESRKLCQVFNSKCVGNVLEFIEGSYSEKELKEDVELAVRIITQEGISTYDKWLRMSRLVAAKQKVHQQRLRDRLNKARGVISV